MGVLKGGATEIWTPRTREGLDPLFINRVNARDGSSYSNSLPF